MRDGAEKRIALPLGLDLDARFLCFFGETSALNRQGRLVGEGLQDMDLVR